MLKIASRVVSVQDASSEIRKDVDCLKLFYEWGISSDSEMHIAIFLMGSLDKWLRKHLVDADYTIYPFDSFVDVKSQDVLSGLIRQAFSPGIITIYLREMFLGIEGGHEIFSLGMSLPRVVKLPMVQRMLFLSSPHSRLLESPDQASLKKFWQHFAQDIGKMQPLACSSILAIPKSREFLRFSLLTT